MESKTTAPPPPPLGGAPPKEQHHHTGRLSDDALREVQHHKEAANDALVRGQLKEALELYAGGVALSIPQLTQRHDEPNTTTTAADASTATENFYSMFVTLVANILALVGRAFEGAGNGSRSSSLEQVHEAVGNFPRLHLMMKSAVRLGSWVLLQECIGTDADEKPSGTDGPHHKPWWFHWRAGMLRYWSSAEWCDFFGVDSSRDDEGGGHVSTTTTAAAVASLATACDSLEALHRRSGSAIVSSLRRCGGLVPQSILLKIHFRLAKLHILQGQLLLQDALLDAVAVGKSSTAPSSSKKVMLERRLIQLGSFMFSHSIESLAVSSHRFSVAALHRRDSPTSLGEDVKQTHSLVVQLGALEDAIRKMLVDGRMARQSSRCDTSMRHANMLHSGVVIAQRIHFSPSEEDLVQHGMGIVAAAPLYAGEAILCETSPLMAAKKREGYEARFVEAVEAIMKIWEPLSAARSCSSSSASMENTLQKKEEDMERILQILSLHARDPEEASTTLQEEDDSEGATDLVLERVCDAWHHNAMRLTDEIDFRIKPAPKSTAAAEGDRDDGGCWEGGSAIYYLGSRINHSCRPNAICCFADATASSSALPFRGTLTVRLLHDVAPGEEILISYCPLLVSRASKQKHCRSFVCACPMCRGIFPVNEESIIAVGDASSTVVALEAVRCVACGAGEVALDDLTATFGHRRGCPVVSHSGMDAPVLLTAPSAAAKAVSEVERRLDEILATYDNTAQQGGGGVSTAAAGGGPRIAMQKLLSLDSCSSVLGPRHWLRLRILQEALAAGVAASITAEESLRITSCARKLLMLVRTICPPHWPLVTGLQMHLVFCLGRHHIGITAAAASTDDGPTTVPTLWKDEDGAEEVRELIVRSLRDHQVQFWGPVAAQPVCDGTHTFLERYHSELRAVGVESVEDLRGILSEAPQ